MLFNLNIAEYCHDVGLLVWCMMFGMLWYAEVLPLQGVDQHFFLEASMGVEGKMLPWSRLSATFHITLYSYIYIYIFICSYIQARGLSRDYQFSEVVSRLRARRVSPGFWYFYVSWKVDFVLLCAVFCWFRFGLGRGLLIIVPLCFAFFFSRWWFGLVRSVFIIARCVLQRVSSVMLCFCNALRCNMLISSSGCTIFMTAAQVNLRKFQATCFLLLALLKNGLGRFVWSIGHAVPHLGHYAIWNLLFSIKVSMNQMFAVPMRTAGHRRILRVCVPPLSHWDLTCFSNVLNSRNVEIIHCAQHFRNFGTKNASKMCAVPLGDVTFAGVMWTWCDLTSPLVSARMLNGATFWWNAVLWKWLKGWILQMF